MATLSLQNLGVLHPEPLFRGLTLVIGPRDRIGLVANNGAGKSTLLKCLVGQIEPSEGTITRSRGLQMGYVPQDIPPDMHDQTLRESLRAAIPAEERDYKEWRVELTLDEFGAPAELRDRAIGVLSGGWQRLALIARCWVNEPDLMLMDEPTNHLDLAKIMLLERWINDTVGDTPMIVTSHDRAFLNSCTNRSLFLRPGASRLYSYSFTRARELLADDDRALETRKARDVRELDRLRRSAHALRQTAIARHDDKAMRKSMVIGHRAERLEEALPQTHAEKVGDIRLANRGTHARVLIACANVSVTAPDGTLLLRFGRLDIFQGDRIVVLGRNGVGKTRFIRLLQDALTDRDAASVTGLRINPSVATGYLDQLMSQLPGEETLRGFIGAFRLGEQRTTSLLVNAGFPMAIQSQRIALLSPGQKARIGLLAVRLAEPNFYLMDEPTNHLDIAGQEQLEAEILAHEATSVLVSHDRQFVTAIGTRFCLIENGRLYQLDTPEPFYRALAEGTSVSASERLHAL